jgi:hypothetical protein
MSEERNLTDKEETRSATYFDDIWFTSKYNRYHALRGDQIFYCENPLGPWTHLCTDELVTEDDYFKLFPGLSHVTELKWKHLTGTYQKRDIHWSTKHKHWAYSNHREVDFSESEESDQATDLDSDAAEVSQLIESATQAVASLSSKLSQPPTPSTSTPQTPQHFPGGLPVTPGPSTQLPTPLATVTARAPSPTLANFPPLPNVPQTPQPGTSKGKQPAHTTTVPRTSTSQFTVNPTSTTTVQPQITPAPVIQVPVITAPPAPPAPVVPAHVAPMATPKILGSAPEPYDGKPEKADAFINNLGNYYFLNTTTFDTDEKKVSSALTYFKIGTPAGEWARDRQSAALSAMPPDFGTWADFQTLFKAHFVPAHTELEATQYLHTNKMGNRPFNEWYQEWSTQAERSHSNAHTKMFCFRKAIPIPLHQKILGVTLAPNTMEELVRLAREFDRNYRL